MNSIFYTISLVFLLSAVLSSCQRTLPVVDALISRLGEEKWSSNEETCLKDTLEMLWGVKNGTLWATWAWDSMQLPTGVFYGTRYHLGNFGQCMSTPSEVGVMYCLVDVKAAEPRPWRQLGPRDDAGEYLKTKTRLGRSINKWSIGVCVPSSCHPDSIVKIYRQLHLLSHLPGGDVTVDPKDCQDPRNKEEWHWLFKPYWTAMFLITIIVVTSSGYSAIVGRKYPVLDSLTKPFCLRRNYNELFKSSASDFRCLHGLRFLTACLIVTTHQCLFMSASPIINTTEMDKMVDYFLGKFVMHVDLIVDTFFVISGLLLANTSLTKNRNIFVVLLKRYIRYIGPYAAVLLFVQSTCHQLGSGPAAPRLHRSEAEVCETHMWRNLLFVADGDMTTCLPISWYIHTEYRLAALGLVLMYIYRRNKKIGILSSVAIVLIHYLQVGYIVYKNRLGVIPMERFHMFEDLVWRRAPARDAVYGGAGARSAPYCVGMLMGGLMAHYKPAVYRNAMNMWQSFLTFLVTLLTLFGTMSVYLIFAHREYSGLEVATVAALNRTVWAVGICSVIAWCEYGNLPILAYFFKHPVFVPLSKLSYIVYLIHVTVLSQHLYTTKSNIEMDIYNIILYILGNLVISISIAFVLYLLVEAPMNNIANNLFSDRKSNNDEIKMETESRTGKTKNQ